MKHFPAVALFLLFPVFLHSQDFRCGSAMRISPGDTPREIVAKAARVCPTERQAAWQEMEFTVFIHFGMNTFTGREWGEKGTSPSNFNPASLDAEQWVRTARDAGAKLLILVAKHHDGFCLWPSRYTDYSVKSSPWMGGKGDVVADVSAACKKYGIGFGFYLSPWDINSPLYGTDEYNAYFRDQLTELLTRYGPVGEVWFDGACGEGPNGKRQVYDWDSYYSLVRRLQPGAVIAVTGPDVRWVGTESGYGRETEWSVVPVPAATMDQADPATHRDGELSGIFKPLGNMMDQDIGSREKLMQAGGLIWYPSEVDVSIRPGWFYHREQDSLVKNAEKLVDIWYSSVGRNSVLLLNIPPDRRGLVHENDVAALKEMRSVLGATFGNDLAKNASVTRNDSVILLEMPGPVTFDRIMLQEDFRHGQRVESFVVEVPEGNGWHEITSGTTIGYKRLLRFDPVRSGKARLRITSSRDLPEITAFGLYKAPGGRP